MLVTEKSLLVDSGGAGLYRGGLGQRIAFKSLSPKPTTPEAFRKFIQDETQKFAELIKTNGLTID
jgi:N-methylhydantoinase B/oxoprolinase/acetone carboxylase alpha subunit